MEIFAGAVLAMGIYFYLDMQSKVKKLEKRVEELESKVGKQTQY